MELSGNNFVLNMQIVSFSKLSGKKNQILDNWICWLLLQLIFIESMDFNEIQKFKANFVAVGPGYIKSNGKTSLKMITIRFL